MIEPNILLVTETGGDITPQEAHDMDIHVLPMHIMLNGENLDDGSFPVQRIFDYHDATRKLPTTSATNPDEYRTLFIKLHEAHPNKSILHLSYSAITTATFQNAIVASEGLNYVTHLDTKNVSAGQATVVLKVAQYLRECPSISVNDLVIKAQEYIKKTRMSFFPGDLDYLRAGGRVSNAAYLGASILGIKPLIEMIDGQLVSAKKYRGSMMRVAQQLVPDFIKKYQPEKDSLFLIYSQGLKDDIKRAVEAIAAQHGFHNAQWIKAGCVVSTHSGPGAFGVGGFATI